MWIKIRKLNKAIYPGNLGLVEMHQFVKEAPVGQAEKFVQLLKQDKTREAVKMLEEFTKKKFHPSIHGLNLLPSHKDPKKKRWQHVLLQKAKPYTRTRKGKFERVKGYNKGLE